MAENAVSEALFYYEKNKIQAKTLNPSYLWVEGHWISIISCFNQLSETQIQPLKLKRWINNLSKLLINPNQEECHTPTDPLLPTPTNFGSPLTSSIHPTSNEERTWGKLWLAKSHLTSLWVTCVAWQGLGGAGRGAGETRRDESTSPSDATEDRGTATREDPVNKDSFVSF